MEHHLCILFSQRVVSSSLSWLVPLRLRLGDQVPRQPLAEGHQGTQFQGIAPTNGAKVGSMNKTDGSLLAKVLVQTTYYCL